jgi:hypothetical protein
VLYILGLLKCIFLSPPKHILVAGDELEKMNFVRYVINQMGPEETLPFFHPQIYCISCELNENEFP